tara:strand:+ start:1432 stop:2043 length:612 start_codon:yes stop_codon:yes gene_type:complete
MNKKELLNKTPFWFMAGSGPIMPLLAPSTITDNALSFRRRKVAANTGKRAMILNGYSPLASSILAAATFAPARINDYMTYNLNSFPEWNFSAKGDDLIDAVRNPEYSSIALIGHGDRTYWMARDRLVEYAEVSEAFGDRPRKNGVWLQAHCGNNSKEPPMGFDVMERPHDTCYFFTRPVRGIEYNWQDLPNRNLRHVFEAAEA